MADFLAQVNQLQQMLAHNPLATMLGFVLIGLGVAFMSGVQIYRERNRRNNEVADRKGIIDLATTFSTALTSQTEINRQMAGQMETIGHAIKDVGRTIKNMHTANLRYFRTQDERLTQIEADISQLKKAA